ncbi:MAG: MFS transporter, partial [Deltaproteobacteria bacterium]|nr:MFS transporter [Deltaproteobacteria bacterium]
FWKEFAIGERGFDDASVAKAVVIAAVGSLPCIFAAGKMLETFGRHRGASVIFGVTSIATVACYSLHGFWPLTIALMGGIFGASAVLTVLTTYTLELFPTHLRAGAFAWANNLLGRIGYVIAPPLVGAAAGEVGWGLAVSCTAVFPLIALALILTRLPETRGKELEELQQA